MKATKGTAPHVMMMAATVKKLTGSISQLCPVQSWPVTRVSTQFTRPYWVSKIQPHTIVAVRAGIAQASSSATETAVRMTARSFVMSTAISTPRIMVAATLTTHSTTLRASTVQNSGSLSTRA